MCNAGIAQNISAEMSELPVCSLTVSKVPHWHIPHHCACLGKPQNIFANALSTYFQSLFAAVLSSYPWTNGGLFYLLHCYTAHVDQILSYHLSCQDSNKQSRFSCYNADFPAATANLVHLWLALDARDLMSSTGFSHRGSLFLRRVIARTLPI